jgi:hypothetical protein
MGANKIEEKKIQKMARSRIFLSPPLHTQRGRRKKGKNIKQKMKLNFVFFACLN